MRCGRPPDCSPRFLLSLTRNGRAPARMWHRRHARAGVLASSWALRHRRFASNPHQRNPLRYGIGRPSRQTLAPVRWASSGGSPNPPSRLASTARTGSSIRRTVAPSSPDDRETPAPWAPGPDCRDRNGTTARDLCSGEGPERAGLTPAAPNTNIRSLRGVIPLVGCVSADLCAFRRACTKGIGYALRVAAETVRRGRFSAPGSCSLCDRTEADAKWCGMASGQPPKPWVCSFQ